MEIGQKLPGQLDLLGGHRDLAIHHKVLVGRHLFRGGAFFAYVPLVPDRLHLHGVHVRNFVKSQLKKLGFLEKKRISEREIFRKIED